VNANEFYTRFIEPNREQMKRSIVRIVHDPDDAADALQDALYKILSYSDAIQTHPNPRAYLMSICISSSYDVLRRRYRTVKNEVQLLSDRKLDAAEPTQPSMHIDTIGLIQQGIVQLPLKQAQAVFLRLFEEEPYKVIGQLLHCTEGTARSHVSKGLETLRLYLRNHDITPSEV
jgi:RNA polymerase sigma factor (sigma-70 family)